MDLICGDYRLESRIRVTPSFEYFRARFERKDGGGRVVRVIRAAPAYRFPDRLERRLFAWNLIEHRNVVRLENAGYDGGRFFIATEWVDGESLARLVDQHSARFTPAAIGMIAHELVRALHTLHTARSLTKNPIPIVHGRLGATSVLVSIHGEVRIDPWVEPGDLGEQAALSTEGDLLALGRLLSTLCTATERSSGREEEPSARAPDSPVSERLGALASGLLAAEWPIGVKTTSEALELAESLDSVAGREELAHLASMARVIPITSARRKRDA